VVEVVVVELEEEMVEVEELKDFVT